VLVGFTLVVFPKSCHDRTTQQHSGEEEVQAAIIWGGDCAFTPAMNAATIKISFIKERKILVERSIDFYFESVNNTVNKPACEK